MSALERLSRDALEPEIPCRAGAGGQIVAANPRIEDPYLIRVGRKLRVPSSH